MNYKTILLALGAATGAALLTAGTAKATDGTLYEGGTYSENTWKTTQLWVHDTVAGDGGVATITATKFQNSTLNQNVNGLTLSGIDFGSMAGTFSSANSYDVTLVGANPFISSTALTEGATISLLLKGEDGSGTLHKTGAGRLTVATPVSGFASVSIDGGTLATSGARLATDSTPVVLKGGATLEPTADVALDALTVQDGVARAKVASGATLTAASLAFADGGALLLDGAGAFKVTGQADAALSPRPVFIASSSTDVAFAAESADGGFTRAADGAAGLTTIDAATTISEATSATAVQVRSRAALTVDGTLAVGDGANPGRILFAKQSDGGADETVAGAGEIAFGAQPGLVLRATPASGNTLTWGVRTTGSAGVQFASAATNGQAATTAIAFPSGYAAAWTGGTRFTGVSATITNTTLAAAGDITFDADGSAAAALTLGVGTYASKFHLSDDAAGSLPTISAGVAQKAPGAPLTFADDVDVAGDVSLKLLGNVVSTRKSVVWAKPISGSGSLKLEGTDEQDIFSFGATNTYAGATTLAGSGVTIVTNGTTLGAGPVAVGGTAWLYYNDVPGATLTNALSGAGKVALQNTSATLGGGEIGSLRLIDGSTAALAGDLAADEVLLNAGTTLQAASGATPTLTMDVAAGETRAIAGGAMGDGDGRLSLVKTGAGELDVGGAHSYTGGTILDAGTLRLVGGVTNGADIAFWLDASKADTVTVAADGSVSAWKSCGGDGVSFGKHPWWNAGFPSAYDAEDRRINGLPTVTFSATGAKDGSGSAATHPTSRLVANKKTTQRMVFMVCRPRIPSSQPGNTGAWGACGRDMGQRLGSDNWSSDTAGASYINGKGCIRQNGSTSLTCKTSESKGVPQVMTFVHERDLRAGQYSSFSDFNVELGGYSTWSDASIGYLSFNGDVAEVIAFNRTLSEAEIRAVENYLGQKWLGTAFHADGLDGAMRTANVLAPAGGLEIRAGATLDLNGVDQTVASLSGQGTIVNTGSRPARLTVTGSWSFRGTIGAGATVRAPGGAEGATADVFVEKGGKIEVSGGTLSVKAFNPAPVTDGLTIWLDASKSETLALDANNAVTGWVSRLPATSRFQWNATTKIRDVNPPPPTNAPTAWLNAKPCVWVPADGAIWSDSKVCARTVFLVMQYKSGTWGMYCWGPFLDDRGIRLAADKVYAFGRFCLLHSGESLWLNGTSYAYEDVGANIAFDTTKPFCFAGRMDDTRGTVGSSTWVLGKYLQSGASVNVAEVLAYDRRLTDTEVAQVNDYLMRKWITSGTAWPAENTAPIATGGGVGAAGSGTLDLGGADVTVGSLTAAGGTISNVGTLTLDGELYVPVTDGKVEALTIAGNFAIGESASVFVDGFATLPRTSRQKALEATGTVTGSLDKTNLTRRYSWEPASGPIWYLGYNCGLLFILR